MDHLPVRGPEARAEKHTEFLLRCRIEQDVRDVLRREVEVQVQAVAVRRPDPTVPEFVPALRVRLDEPQDVVRFQEPEPLVPDREGRDEVVEVDPSVRVHLQAVPVREMAEDARHRPAEGVDLLVLEQEAGVRCAAHRAHLFTAVVSVRTAFPEQGNPPGASRNRTAINNFASGTAEGGPPRGPTSGPDPRSGPRGLVTSPSPPPSDGSTRTSPPVSAQSPGRSSDRRGTGLRSRP